MAKIKNPENIPYSLHRWRRPKWRAFSETCV